MPVFSNRSHDKEVADQKYGYLLPHHRRQPDKLQHVPRDEEQRIEQLLLFAGGPTRSEEYNEDCHRAYQGDDKVQDIKRGLPELLHPQSQGT